MPCLQDLKASGPTKPRFDCTSLCRENIEKDIEREKRQADEPDKMEEDEADPVPCITRAHFEEVCCCCAWMLSASRLR